MNFGSLLSIIIFCAGATFTLLDVGSDALLASEYWYHSDKNHADERGWTTNKLHYETNFIFACLTTAWFALGGFFQACWVIYLFIGSDSRLDVLPKRLQILLVVSTTVLMGPVVINIYGAYFVYHNANSGLLQEKINRYLLVAYLICRSIG